MVVGLGEAGAIHVKALQHIPNITIVAVIDTNDSRTTIFHGTIPVYHSTFEALSGEVNPDLVTIATPTPTHVEVCSQVAEYFPRSAILVEKPAADNFEDARRIVEGIGGKQSVTISYHMAFGAEVEWGLSRIRSERELLGSPIRIESWYADPYQSELSSAQARLGTSWIDSGVNALSVIERFARVLKRTSFRQIGQASWSVFEGTFACQAQGAPVAAVVLTSWHSTAATRTTRIRYSSGAELVMDHNAVAGYILKDGAILSTFGSDGAVPRREAHYRALYKSWLTDNDQVFSPDASLRLHRLLLDNIQLQ
jgi:predicted dehydrogenase